MEIGREKAPVVFKRDSDSSHCRLVDLTIDNFKSFNDFEMMFNPLTVIIGDNAVGKSSLLQAIAFLKYACTASVDEYMKDRGVKVEDLTSRGLPKIKKIMSFTAIFDLGEYHLSWVITFATDKTNNRMTLRSELVTKIGPSQSLTLLEYDAKSRWRLRRDETKGTWVKESITAGAYPSSILRFIDERNGEEQYPELMRIKQFFEETEPLDLLTPRDMRKTVRGKSRSLGMSGEKLPALVHQLSGKEKQVLVAELRKALPNLQGIESKGGRAGWTHLEIQETFGRRHFEVPSSGISDGTLRMMALLSLGFLNRKHGMTLLDEVEDGINVSNIQLFLSYISQYIRDNDQQVVLTTHSTVVLDYVDPANIRYFYRDENGFTRCKNFAELKEVKRQLDFLYPGEILLNTDPAELVSGNKE